MHTDISTLFNFNLQKCCFTISNIPRSITEYVHVYTIIHNYSTDF